MPNENIETFNPVYTRLTDAAYACGGIVPLQSELPVSERLTCRLNLRDVNSMLDNVSAYNNWLCCHSWWFDSIIAEEEKNLTIDEIARLNELRRIKRKLFAELESKAKTKPDASGEAGSEAGAVSVLKELRKNIYMLNIDANPYAAVSF